MASFQDLKKYEKDNPAMIDKLEKLLLDFKVKDREDYRKIFDSDTDYEMADYIMLLKNQEKIVSKWLMYLANEKEVLIFLDEARKKLYKYKYLFYQKDGTYDYVPENRAEADMLIQADTDYSKLLGLHARQEILVDYIKGLSDKVRFMSSEIKQLIEWERYISGG